MSGRLLVLGPLHFDIPVDTLAFGAPVDTLADDTPVDSWLLIHMRGGEKKTAPI